MLPDLKLECPFCSKQFAHIDLVQHLKQEHNFAITRLIQFHDPRYYLKLLEAKGAQYLMDHSVKRKTDGVMMLCKDPEDQELRRIAFAFQRHRAIEQINYELQAKTTRQCFWCQQLIPGTF